MVARGLRFTERRWFRFTCLLAGTGIPAFALAWVFAGTGLWVPRTGMRTATAIALYCLMFPIALPLLLAAFWRILMRVRTVWFLIACAGLGYLGSLVAYVVAAMIESPDLTYTLTNNLTRAMAWQFILGVFAPLSGGWLMAMMLGMRLRVCFGAAERTRSN